MTYKTIAGAQQANDNAMIRNTVFESLTVLSMLRLRSLLNICGERFKWAHIMMYVRQVVRMDIAKIMFSAITAYSEANTLKAGRIKMMNTLIEVIQIKAIQKTYTLSLEVR